jgi:hypothetical protein
MTNHMSQMLFNDFKKNTAAGKARAKVILASALTVSEPGAHLSETGEDQLEGQSQGTRQESGWK